MTKNIRNTIMEKKFLWVYTILVFIANMANGQDIISSSPIVLPLTGQTSYTVASGQTVNIIGNGSITLNPGVSILSGAKVLIKLNNSLVIPPPPSNPASDLNRNWVMTRSYDENGNEIGATKSFFDNNGKATQAQQKNETTSQVLATQTLYDLQGRAVVSTLPAPINNSAFAYNPNFVTSGGTPYSYVNFDGDPTNTTNPLSKLNNPDQVDNATQGTLGWYYSNNNSQEAMVGATGFPYSRVDFYHDGTGAQKRESGIGEQLKMGTGHETSSNSFPVQNELNTYLTIRNQFFPTAVVGDSPTSMAGQALQSISTDQNGTSVLSVTDLTGKLTLMTARVDATSNAWLPVRNTLNLSNVQGQYVLYINTSDNGTNFSGSPSGGTTGVYLPFNITNLSINSGSNPVNVYCTDCQVPLIYSGVGSGFVFPTGGGEFNYLITSAYPFYTSSYGGSTIFYDQVEATFQEPPTTAIQYFSLASQSSVTITGGAYTLYDMKSEQDITSVYQSNNTLPAGYYKIVATAPVASGLAPTNNVTVSYTNTYSDISYNYYNQLGQLIASITPNGVQQLLNNIGNLSQYTSTTLPFTTTYKYDLQGRLISTTSPDAGSSAFVYRQDGKIRFSINSYQLNPANSVIPGGVRFSYTNYDGNGRPIESGEYAVASLTAFSNITGNSTILEATDPTGGLSGGTKLSQINTYYDLPATNLNLSGYVQDPGFLKGAVSYTTNTVNGVINSSTWYNYDDHGRVTWVVKQINGLGTKTINYTYNAQGNVAQVAYQQGATDQFIHYYSYDADGRLINVQTSTDGVNKVQQANYYYYLHGPLKRMELGNQLQGIDYVYTPQGWLKAINSPTGNAANDPMQDGLANSFAKDAFGMQLEYFTGDYNRLGSNVTGIPTGTTTYFNGNVSGMSWQSNKPSSVVSSDPTGTIQNPTMYTYTYDPKYQYNGSVWGTPNYSSGTFAASSNNMFQEKQISYDPNGNILGLQRTDKNGNLADDFSNYQYGRGNQLASVGNTAGTTSYASYSYDEIGRLKSQVGTNGPMYLTYDVTGKITGIYADAALATLKVAYAYDEMGNRISRTDNTGPQPLTTYYVYDPNGSAMAIYTGSTPALTEVPVYGSSRLGTYFAAANNYVYEMRDNVGSVRIAINGTKVNGQADIRQYNDYYPYGSLAQNGGAGYRYEYQGAYAEKDAVSKYNNFELRMYDGRIGRWLSVDPKGQDASPYEGMGNNPTNNVDPSGGGHLDSNGNWVADPTDDATYGYLGQVTYKGSTYTWMGQDAGWIAEGQASNSTLNKMYNSYTDAGQNPFQGAYANQLRYYANSFEGVQNEIKRNLPMLNFAAKVAQTAAYAGTGGLSAMTSEAGGTLSSYLFNNSSYAVKATNGAVSFLGQGLTNGFNHVDYADVAFDTFGTQGSSAIFDGAIDLQINGNGPQLGVVLINKDIQLGVNQAASNYLINKVGDFKVIEGDAVTPAATNFMGKILQMTPGFN